MPPPMRPILSQASRPATRLLGKQTCPSALLAARRSHSTQPTSLTTSQPRSSRISTTSRTHLRAFHSYDHPAPPGPFSAAETAILSAAYAHIPEHGFTQHTLALGARDAGYLDISTNLLPDGIFSLIRYHLTIQREALAGRAAELFEGKTLSVGQRVEALTWERLLGNKEVIGRWQEALAVMAQPTYVPASVKELALLADEIWFLAGDVSVDPSWYTKRATLSGIYGATELFMTNDRSAGFRETREFLGRRIGATNEIGGYVRSIGEWVGFTASAGVNVLRSKGVRI